MYNISVLGKSLSAGHDYQDFDIEGEPEALQIGKRRYADDDDIEGEPEALRIGKQRYADDDDIEGEPEALIIYKQKQNSEHVLNYQNINTELWDRNVYIKDHKRQSDKKKKKKKKCGNYFSIEKMDKNYNGGTDKSKDIKLSKEDKNEKGGHSYSSRTDIDMREIERHIREEVIIRRIHDKLYYFDGRIYRPLNKENFLLLLRSKLPSKIEHSIPTYHRMEEAYKYLMVNPDIKMNITPEMENFVKNCIVFSNCIYDVKSDKVYDFSCEYPFLFYVNAKYITKNRECSTPNFDNFIERISDGSKAIKDLIMQMIGYITMHSMDAKCFFLFGPAPNSGKSVLGEFIARLFDEEFVGTLPLTELGRRFALGSLWKHAVNVSMDLPTRSLTEQEVSQIKMITGEKRVNTEEKYEPTGTTYLHCKCIYASNGKISLKTYDRAFWDRVVFVPFLHSVPKAEQDRDLLDKLLAEQDGIVTKSAAEARKLIYNNFIFNIPKSAKDILDEWSQESSDSITRFFESECVIDCNCGVFSCDLYDRYKEFCSINYIQPETQALLGKRVNELPGIFKVKKRKQKDSSPIWKYEGIRLKESI